MRPRTVLVALALAACGTVGTGFQRAGEVDDIAEGLGEAVGVEELNPSAHHRRSAPGCAAVLELPDDGAWYERRSYSLIPDGPSATGLERLLAAHLRDEGFEVTELVAPLSGTRGIRAVRDDVGVLVDIAGEGANVMITAGPCAVQLTPVPERFEVVEEP